MLCLYFAHAVAAGGACQREDSTGYQVTKRHDGHVVKLWPEGRRMALHLRCHIATALDALIGYVEYARA